MAREIVFGFDARRRLIDGMSVPARAIAAAYGPRGRGVLFHRPPAAPEIVFDGMTIARELQPRGSVERQGGAILKETMFDLNRDIGDGSSSLALIAHGILAKSLPLIQAGYAPKQLADALLELGRLIDSDLHKISEPFVDDHHSMAVARSAAGGDLEVAGQVVSILRRLGPGGYVMVKEGHGLETRQEFFPGMSVSAGHVSPALSKSKPDETDFYNDPYILLCDETIGDFRGLVPVLEGFARTRKSLVIFARNVTGKALATLIVNVQKADLNAAAVAIPEVGDRLYDALEDIAVLTEAEVVSARSGTSVQSMNPGMLGRAKRVEISDDKCVLVCEMHDHQRLEARKLAIRDEMHRARYLSYDKEKLEVRLARLSGGVAEVRVGAHSIPEKKLRVLRYEKALHALQSARRSGVVPGGGAAYSHVVPRFKLRQNGRASAAAAEMLTSALRGPEQRLIQSVGGDPVLTQGAAADIPGRLPQVFDVHGRCYLGPDKLAILDSAEITGEVVKRSISMAATILRSEVCVSRP